MTEKQKLRRDERILKALEKGLSLRQIAKKGIAPKSTAYDVGVRYGVRSVRSTQ